MTKARKTAKELQDRRARRKPEAKELREELRNVVRRQTTRLRDTEALASRRRVVATQLEDAERILRSPFLDHRSVNTVTRYIALPARDELMAIDTRLHQNLKDYHTQQPLWENTAGRIEVAETQLRGGEWNSRIDKDYWRRADAAYTQKSEMRNIGMSWDNASGIVDYGQALPQNVPLYN